jgi:DNA-binding beta-propeller fold protein YncE
MANLAAVQRPISSLPIAARISIPGSPDWVAIGANSVWISNAGADSLARIDPSTNKLAKVVPIGRRPCSGLAVGFGAVWAPSCADNRVDRVDQDSNDVVAIIPTSIGDSEGGIAAGEGAIWLAADRHGKLFRIDAALNKVDGEAKLADGSFVPVAGAGAVWVSSTEHNLVSRVHPAGLNVVAEIPVGPSPRFMACTETDVWVLNQGNGTVTRIDIASNQVVAAIDAGVPGQGGDIAVGEGFVWVTMIDIPLTQIDPATNKVVAQYVGKGGDSLRIGHGAAWMCSFFLQEVWRVPLPL